MILMCWHPGADCEIVYSYVTTVMILMCWHPGADCEIVYSYGTTVMILGVLAPRCRLWNSLLICHCSNDPNVLAPRCRLWNSLLIWHYSNDPNVLVPRCRLWKSLFIWYYSNDLNVLAPRCRLWNSLFIWYYSNDPSVLAPILAGAYWFACVNHFPVIPVSGMVSGNDMWPDATIKPHQIITLGFLRCLWILFLWSDDILKNVVRSAKNVFRIFHCPRNSPQYLKDPNSLLIAISGLILGLHPANERRCYYVTTSLIGWAQTMAMTGVDCCYW